MPGNSNTAIETIATACTVNVKSNERSRKREDSGFARVPVMFWSLVGEIGKVERTTDSRKIFSNCPALIADDRIAQFSSVACFSGTLYLDFSSSKLLFEVSLDLLPEKREERPASEFYSLSSGSALLSYLPPGPSSIGGET
jgi:hypothetical protein